MAYTSRDLLGPGSSSSRGFFDCQHTGFVVLDLGPAGDALLLLQRLLVRDRQVAQRCWFVRFEALVLHLIVVQHLSIFFRILLLFCNFHQARTLFMRFVNIHKPRMMAYESP